MKKINILFVLLILVFTSCNIYRYEEHQTHSTQPGGSSIITPTTADLKVSETKISYTSTFSHNKNENDINIKEVKKKTLADALFEYNADILIDPLFDITTSKDASHVDVTVTGYPANYVNFRTTTQEDSILLTYTSHPSIRLIVSEDTRSLTSGWSVKRGWQNSICFKYQIYDNLGGEYIGGYRFNRYFLIGLGVGYWNEELYEDEHHIPLYAHARVYFRGEKRINPYLGISQGVDFHIYDGELFVGSHTRAEVGVNFRCTQKFNLFLSYGLGTSPYVYGSSYYYRIHEFVPAEFKLGVTF